jgi:hypothetical protein
MSKFIFICLICVYFNKFLFAEDSGVKPQETPIVKSKEMKELEERIEKKLKEIDDAEAKFNTQFAGINFGVGMALSFKSGRDRIESAIIQDKTVYVEKETNREPKLMLETHYFFTPEKAPWFGFGPFLGVQPDTAGGNLISAYAIGAMIGFKRKGSSSSFNLGVAYNVNTNVKVLGDGLTAGGTTSEANIRYKYINQPGILIMVSFGF